MSAGSRLKKDLIKVKIKLALITAQLKLSHLVSKLATLIDKLAIKLQPEPFLHKVGDNKHGAVFQVLGPMSAWGGKNYFEVYMDGVDWQHEFGEIKTSVYSSVDEVKEGSKCWEGCGVVKLNLKVISQEWSVKQDLFNPKNLVEYKPKKGKKRNARRRKGNDSKS